MTVPDEDVYYVYAYFDDKGYPFYIGKGKGNRINSHVKPSLRSEKSYKNHKINQLIKSQGFVHRSILAYLSDENDAYLLEESLIRFYGLKCDGGLLTNVCRSHFDSSAKYSNKASRNRSSKKLISYSEQEAVEIIDLHRWKIFNQQEIAEIYNISSSVVGSLLCGKTKLYQHLDTYHVPKVAHVYEEIEILQMLVLRQNRVPIKQILAKYEISKTQFYRLINKYTAGAGTSTDPTNISTGDANLENTA